MKKYIKTLLAIMLMATVNGAICQKTIKTSKKQTQLSIKKKNIPKNPIAEIM